MLDLRRDRSDTLLLGNCNWQLDALLGICQLWRLVGASSDVGNVFEPWAWSALSAAPLQWSKLQPPTNGFSAATCTGS